jgi:Arc/MetJ-type ribon-helix-helix transcriptional regulator
MAQFVTRVEDALTDRVDSLVVVGVFASRSDAVRAGLERLVDELERERIGALIVEGYRRVPQSEDELGWVDAATEQMIGEEPW